MNEAFAACFILSSSFQIINAHSNSTEELSTEELSINLFLSVAQGSFAIGVVNVYINFTRNFINRYFIQLFKMTNYWNL